MPPPSVKITDEASTAKLVSAFNDASQENAWAVATLRDIQAQLSTWTGYAGGKFREGVDMAAHAVSQIDEALNEISGSMQTFARETQTTEDDNQSAAANAALGFAAGWNPSWT
jgi:hypothetical protein